MGLQEEDEPNSTSAFGEEVSAADRQMAQEIADFIAARAFRFEDHECRAWALTDFGVWATLSGHEAELKLVEPG